MHEIMYSLLSLWLEKVEIPVFHLNNLYGENCVS